MKCADCGIKLSDAADTGNKNWCEDCFDKGLHKDMNSHWNDYWKNQLKESGIVAQDAIDVDIERIPDAANGKSR